MRRSIALVLAFTYCAVARAATPPADPPFRVWGQVTGSAPSPLEAQLVPAAGGSPVVTAAARVTPTTGGAFYEAAFPAAPVKAAGGLALRFVGAGATPGTSTVPFVSSPLPLQVHLVDGVPVLPVGRVLMTEAHLTTDAPPKIHFIMVLARTGGTPAGTVNWHGAAAAPLPGDALTAKVPGVTIHRQSITTTAGTTPPVVWSASFRSTDAKEPWLHARTLLADVEERPVDNLGQATGDLPAASDLALSDKVYKLGTGSLAVEAGDYLSLHLETSVGGESAVRSALTSWTLSTPVSAGTTAPIALPLSACTVHPLPSGGSWVSATWLCPKKVTLSPAALVGPAGASLTGSWKVRALTRFVLVGSKEDF